MGLSRKTQGIERGEMKKWRTEARNQGIKEGGNEGMKEERKEGGKERQERQERTGADGDVRGPTGSEGDGRGRTGMGGNGPEGNERERKETVWNGQKRK